MQITQVLLKEEKKIVKQLVLSLFKLKKNWWEKEINYRLSEEEKSHFL